MDELYVVVYAIVLVFIAGAENWLFFGKYRWYISVYGTDTRTSRSWYDARQWCMMMGGELARYDTNTVRDWLKEKVKIRYDYTRKVFGF